MLFFLQTAARTRTSDFMPAIFFGGKLVTARIWVFMRSAGW